MEKAPSVGAQNLSRAPVGGLLMSGKAATKLPLDARPLPSDLRFALKESDLP
jgi:hypothetical protein